MERGYPYLVKKHLPCAGAAVAFLLLFILARPAEAQSAFVRVSQVGFITSASKRAYLMSSGSEAGAAFQVKNSTGATVFSAPNGANQGSWSKRYPFVYALDFSSLMTPGTYTIAVNAPIFASSPNFRIDTAANLYATPVSNALSFYENERDGPNFIPTALRTAAGHVNDATANVYFTPRMNANGHFSGDLRSTATSASKCATQS